MSARALFKQADLTRALKAAERAGVPVRIDIEPGRMIVTPIDAKASSTGNTLDALFA
ncbi:MAG TPA: hypothetical protein VF695_04715 [Sphingomonas sp.]|jgi:hypothetical protein